MNNRITINVMKPGRVVMDGVEYFSAIELLEQRYMVDMAESPIVTERVCKWTRVIEPGFVYRQTACGHDYIGPLHSDWDYCPYCGSRRRMEE